MRENFFGQFLFLIICSFLIGFQTCKYYYVYLSPGSHHSKHQSSVPHNIWVINKNWYDCPAREITRLCGTMIQSNNWPFNINHKNFISRITNNTYKIFKRIGTRCTALYRKSACSIFENVQNWLWNNLRYIETICATSKLVKCHLRRPWRYSQ